MIVRWTRRALKDLDKAPHQIQENIEIAIDKYAADEAGDVRHLVNSNPARYRLRVGTWRVIFIRGRGEAAAEKQIDILRILPRDKAYRS